MWAPASDCSPEPLAVVAQSVVSRSSPAPPPFHLPCVRVCLCVCVYACACLCVCVCVCVRAHLRRHIH